MERVFYSVRESIKHYVSGSNMLIAATLLAMIIVNIPACTEFYQNLWTHEIALQIGGFHVFSHHGHPMTVMQFINDALMALFFLHIGLEIKREVLIGELSSFRKALLPIIGAIGGMLVPVGIFCLIGQGSNYMTGAAIPMATDISFSLGVLAILGTRVPISLKIFLTTLAVADDIGGILVIATCYPSHIDLQMLGISAALLGVLLLGSRFRIQSKMFYLGIGAVIWYLFLNAGIHPTIAGVLIAFCVPATPVDALNRYIHIIQRNANHFKNASEMDLHARSFLSKQQMDWLKQINSASDKVISPLQELEDSLHPLVNFVIVPLFAFANAGIYLGDFEFASIFQGVSLAIMAGLVIGKFTGIFSFSWICIKLGLAPMPQNANWSMLAAVSMLGGIGFTVSLFIANLSFTGDSPEAIALLNDAKLGIVMGSLISGLIGYILLKITLPKHLHGY